MARGRGVRPKGLKPWLGVRQALKGRAGGGEQLCPSGHVVAEPVLQDTGRRIELWPPVSPPKS